jgi:hypothetical protein
LIIKTLCLLDLSAAFAAKIILEDLEMLASREELIAFLEREVLGPAELHPNADKVIKMKVRTTRMRLNKLISAEKVEEFFWHAMSTDRGIDSYTRIHRIGAQTFEDVRAQFKQMCGRED